MSTSLPLAFYRQKDVVALSRSLIGKFLFTRIGPKKIVTGGMIVETEAYKGAEDRACHAYNWRRTKRTEIMYSNGGVSYVYFCYGMHHLFNIITYKKEIPYAILIRAIEPTEGIELMQERRGKKDVKELANGPGNVCQALGITMEQNGISLKGPAIWLEDRGVDIAIDNIAALPRVGVAYAGEDAKLPWRFLLSQGCQGHKI